MATREGVPEHCRSSFPTLSLSHQHHDPGLGLPLVHQLHDGLDASSHLLCGVPVVIGTHPDHHNLWKERHEAVVRGQAKGALAAHPSPAHLGPDVFQLPVLQTPQHVLCAVTANAKVKCMKRGKELPPDLWARSGVGTGALSAWTTTLYPKVNQMSSWKSLALRKQSG